MSSPKSVLFGFHAVTVRLKTHADSVAEVHFDPARRDQRMRAFIERAKEAGAKLVESSDERLSQLAGSPRHQGVVARVQAIAQPHSLDDVLDAVEG
ncbi:MAG TPA: RNA methyltransferase substrate-binding domain-containing protein, partial [Roseateles sp.]